MKCLVSGSLIRTNAAFAIVVAGSIGPLGHGVDEDSCWVSENVDGERIRRGRILLEDSGTKPCVSSLMPRKLVNMLTTTTVVV